MLPALLTLGCLHVRRNVPAVSPPWSVFRLFSRDGRTRGFREERVGPVPVAQPRRALLLWRHARPASSHEPRGGAPACPRAPVPWSRLCLAHHLCRAWGSAITCPSSSLTRSPFMFLSPGCPASCTHLGCALWGPCMGRRLAWPPRPVSDCSQPAWPTTGLHHSVQVRSC